MHDDPLIQGFSPAGRNSAAAVYQVTGHIGEYRMGRPEGYIPLPWDHRYRSPERILCKNHG